MTTPVVTRTCQPTFTTAGLLTALETAWAAIRARHPEVPDAVLIVGSGSPAKGSQSMKWGHFAKLRWQSGDTQLPEVLVSGEGLSRTPAEVFTTLLHEATHGLAETRNIQDTSRQGRWHNKKFATLAAELGMSAVKDDKLGYSPCTLTDQAQTEYADAIGVLGRALRAFRHPEPTGDGKERTNNNNGVTAECECPRKIRLSATVFDQGPIVCGECATAFLPADVDRDSYTFPTFGTPCNHDQADTDHDTDSEDPMVFYDPEGVRFGIPTFPYRFAPQGLATVRQLRAQNLRPGGQDVAAQILWRRGKRCAYLYRIDLAKPKRTASAAQLAALDKAHRAQRTCPACGDVKPYYIPRRTGACLDCTHPEATPMTPQHTCVSTPDTTPVNPKPANGSAVDRLQDGVLLVIVLLVGIMAGAASFSHVHDWTIDNSPANTPDWFGWANAVISELIPTAALITIGRRRRANTGQSIAYPMVLLVAAVGVSLTAQLAVAQPSVFGWMVSALPALAFFALSKLVFSATASPRPTTPVTAPAPATSPAPSIDTPRVEVSPAAVRKTRATPAKKNTPAKKTPARTPAKTTTAPATPDTTPAAPVTVEPTAPVALVDQRYPELLLSNARTIAASHRDEHGEDIKANQLAVRLRVPTPDATDILTQLRTLPTATASTASRNGSTVGASA